MILTTLIISRTIYSIKSGVLHSIKQIETQFFKKILNLFMEIVKVFKLFRPNIFKWKIRIVLKKIFKKKYRLAWF